jgi:hypothetical protein
MRCFVRREDGLTKGSTWKFLLEISGFLSLRNDDPLPLRWILSLHELDPGDLLYLYFL